jgi:DNA-directed RNA polymerase subunit RPC12/RpoP
MADNRYTRSYACTKCGKEVPSRDRLTVKKAVFTTMGSPAKTLRSRVTVWLCPECLTKDADWNREPYSDPAEYADQLMIPTPADIPLSASA